MKTFTLINIVLLLAGAAIMALGLNIGLGGIQTLGWQLPRDFITITDPATFAVQDSHIRFIGGVWFAVGGVFAFGGFFISRIYPTLITLCGMIAIGGFFRLSGAGLDVRSNAELLPSFMLEILGFPLLAFWLFKSQQKT